MNRSSSRQQAETCLVTVSPDEHTLDRFDFDAQKKSGLKPLLGNRLQRAFLKACCPMGSLFGQRLSDAFGILMYHRIAPRSASRNAPPYNVTPERFKIQLSGLLAKGYEAWSLKKVLQHRQENRPIPRKVFVVTFDDGYANNYTHAWPILRELSIPATIFLATAYLNSNQPFPFDRWQGVGAIGEEQVWAPLSTNQCEELLSGGLIELGAHTHTHADFRGHPEEFIADLDSSIDTLFTEFGITTPSFAFPQGRKASGFAGSELVEAARKTDICCALTTESDLVQKGADPIGHWGRFTVENSDTPCTLATRLDGWYEGARQTYRLLRQR